MMDVWLKALTKGTLLDMIEILNLSAYTPDTYNNTDIIENIEKMIVSVEVDKEGIISQADVPNTINWHELPLIKAKTLVIAGADDMITRPIYSRKMAELIPDAQLKIIKGGGHGVPAEKTKEYVSELISFWG